MIQVYPWQNKEEFVGSYSGGNIQNVKEVLEFAKMKNKPIMIAESAPFGGMNREKLSNAAREYFNRINVSAAIVNKNSIWNLWFKKVIDLIYEYDIRMWSYINCDWDSQPMWNNVGFGDTRLSSSEYVMKQWWNQILYDAFDDGNNRFLLRLSCSTKNTSQIPFPSYEETYIAILSTLKRSVNEWELNPPYLLLICIGFVLPILFLRRLARLKFFNNVPAVSESFSSLNQHESSYGSFGIFQSDPAQYS